MKTSELIQQLVDIQTKYGDLPVIVDDGYDSLTEIARAKFKLAAQGDYSADCNLPDNFKFVALSF